MMESSSESLTMKMKPRLNMQVAAACWTRPRSGKQSCRSTPRDSKLLSRKENGPQRHVIGGLLGKKKTLVDNLGRGHGRLEEGAGSAGVGDRCLLQGSAKGQWEQGVDPPPTPACLPVLPVTSSPALGWQEEWELFCHPGKHWRSNREPPFLCVDEAGALFSPGGLMSPSKARGGVGAPERTGPGRLCQRDQKTTGKHPEVQQRRSNKEPINNHEGMVDRNCSTVGQ